MKSTKFLFFVALLVVLVVSQTQAQTTIKTDTCTTFANQTIKKNSTLFNYKRMSFSVDMGLGFIGSKYYSGSFMYLSPFMSYLVTPRFRLDIGGTILQGLNNLGSTAFHSFGGNGTTAMVFARGNYLVSNRLIISGSIYKTFDNYKPTNTDLLYNSKKGTFDNYGVSVGVDYKISEHMSIGAQVSYSNGNNNPFYSSPTDPNYNGFQSGFNRGNAYRSGFMGW
ncbi:MAG: hypothetical protein WCQ95_12655 [Bacteroidota bacterium]